MTTFSSIWEISRRDFDRMLSRRIELDKNVFLSKNRISYQFAITISAKTSWSDFFGVYFSYKNEPVGKVQFKFSVSLMANDGSIHHTWSGIMTDKPRCHTKWIFGFPDYAYSDFRNHKQIDPRVSIKFHLQFDLLGSSFAYSIEYPIVQSTPDWLRRIYDRIQSPDNNHYDVKFESADDAMFFCHKFVFEQQSEPFAAMFRFQQQQLTTASAQSEKPIRFDTLIEESLRILIQYLYTGNASEVDKLFIFDIIELAHVADQYEVAELSRACVASLRNIAGETNDLTYLMAIFSYGRLKNSFLEYRALSGLAECLSDSTTSVAKLLDDQYGIVEGAKAEIADRIASFRDLFANRLEGVKMTVDQDV